MKHFIEKILIFLLCAIIFFPNYHTSTTMISVLLLTISFGSIQLAITNQKVSFYLSITFFILSCFCNPLMLFTPVIFYENYYTEDKTQTALTILLTALSIAFIPHEHIILFILLSICSLYFSRNNHQLMEQKKAIYELRDSDIEHIQLLKEKNKIIVRQQNDLIHTTTLQERNRIAREIHDNVGHMLTRSILQLGALKAVNKDEHLTPLFENLLETLNQSMTSIRKSVHDLHDESIDLKQSIQTLIDSIEKKFDIQFDYSMGASIPKEIKYNFISIIKEALTNCCKYSNGNKITIIVLEHPGFYQLLIEDNGTNIDVDNSNTGIGLTNMKDRISALSGTFKVSTQNGFRIFISIMKEGLK